MHKLFKLKEWVTLEEAAKYLAAVFGEDVSVADVLRLACDGHLSISAYFVNHVTARKIRFVPWEEHKELVELSRALDEMQGRTTEKSPEDLLRPVQLCDDKVLTLSGTWDLAMIGGERLDIEHRFLSLADGPAVTLTNIDGAFVCDRDEQLYQLLEDFDDNPHLPGSSASLEQLNGYIAANRINGDAAALLLSGHEEKRKAFLEERKTMPRANRYYPAGGLPKDAMVVVRTEALRDFEQEQSDTPKQKDLSTTERTTLLTIIAALCDYSDIDHQGRGAATQIAKMTEEIGSPVSDDAVRRALQKIPEALQARMR